MTWIGSDMTISSKIDDNNVTSSAFDVVCVSELYFCAAKMQLRYTAPLLEQMHSRSDGNKQLKPCSIPDKTTRSQETAQASWHP